jgi:ribosomal protein S8
VVLVNKNFMCLAYFIALIRLTYIKRIKICSVPFKRLFFKILQCLLTLNLIYGFTLTKNNNLKVFLKYNLNFSNIKNFILISKPGNRIF